MQNNLRPFLYTLLELIMIFTTIVSCNPRKNVPHKIAVLSPINYTKISLPIDIHSQHITTANGLPDNCVYSMYQDHQGFIWFCTLDGLARYDGNSFLIINKNKYRFSLKDNRIRDVKEDHNGLLWIHTSQEHYTCYDLHNSKFLDYTGTGDISHHYNSFQEFPGGNIWLYGHTDGCLHTIFDGRHFVSHHYGRQQLGSNNIFFVINKKCSGTYIGTDKGLFLFVGNKLQYLAKGIFIMAASTPKGLYFITRDGFLFFSQGRNIKFLEKISVSPGCKITDFTAYQNNLLIFTSQKSYIFNIRKHQFKQAEGKWNIPNGQVIKDNKNHLWIFNKTGMLYRLSKNKIYSYKFFPSNRLSYINSERYHITQDKRGLIWISTYGNGLFVIDPRTENIQHIEANASNGTNLATNFLQNVMVDRSGGIWASGEYTGINHLEIINRGIKNIFLSEQGNLNRSNTIRMVTQLPDSTVVVGNKNGMLYHYNQHMDQLLDSKHFDANIYSIMRQSDGTLWTGTKGDGLYIGKKHYRKGTISDDDIYCMLADKKRQIWLGTFGGGLNLAYQHKTGYTFKSFFANCVGLQEVRCLMEDNNGMIWAGTSGGILIFNPNLYHKKSLIYYRYNSSNGILPGDEVRWIMQDRKNDIWIALAGDGIIKCKIGTLGYKHPQMAFYDTMDGLVNNKIQGIVEDRHGDKWISTEYGISHYIDRTGQFENHFFSSFMLGNVYSENSSLTLKDGRLLFGTNHGLLIVDPSLTDRANDRLHIIFTDLKFNGQSISPEDKDSPLKRAMSYTSDIQLNHEQNSFVVNFSTLSFSELMNVKYQYKLDGYDTNWSRLSSLPMAAYRNLPPGTYHLFVRACDAYGSTSKVATLKIKIATPLYRSWWALIIYCLILSMVTYYIWVTIHKMNRLRNKIHLEEALTKYKLQFFTNISHEFRTPLTLIQGSLERVERTMQNNQYCYQIDQSVNIMKKSVQRMMRLIDQLLTFSKIQNEKLGLALEQVEIISFLNSIFYTFSDAAISKNINYHFEPSITSYEIFTDKGHLDKIIYNLLSNAFKYTPCGGCITLKADIEKQNDILRVTVCDTGIGITAELQTKLFSRFVQSNYSGDSFGIGLNLTKKLIQILKGTIHYQENPNGGSIFIIELPLNKSIYNPKDFLNGKRKILKSTNTNWTTKSLNITSEMPLNQYTILLIEDDNDVRSFVASELQHYFHIVTAIEGKEGLAKAHQADIDLIVSDIMMPGMDGIELCQNIRSDFELSHIPIILLTALSTEENQLKGIQAGADAYITKPFSPSILCARIFQLLQERRRLRDKFSKDLKQSQPPLVNNEEDAHFADKLQQILLQNLKDADFSMNDMAEQMRLGRTLFYRKVKGVTGYTPNEYLQIMRLKKGAELLNNDCLTVAEVAYKVGFNNPFYFSKCFKNLFGKTPTDYKKTN